MIEVDAVYIHSGKYAGEFGWTSVHWSTWNRAKTVKVELQATGEIVHLPPADLDTRAHDRFAPIGGDCY